MFRVSIGLTTLDAIQWELSDWKLTRWAFWTPPHETIAELYARWGWQRTRSYVDGTVGELHGIAYLQGQVAVGDQLQIRMMWWCMGFRLRPNEDPNPDGGPVSFHAPMDWRPLKLDVANNEDTVHLQRLDDGAEVNLVDLRGEPLDRERKQGALRTVTNEAKSVWDGLLASLPVPPFPEGVYPPGG